MQVVSNIHVLSVGELDPTFEWRRRNYRPRLQEEIRSWHFDHHYSSVLELILPFRLNREIRLVYYGSGRRNLDRRHYERVRQFGKERDMHQGALPGGQQQL